MTGAASGKVNRSPTTYVWPARGGDGYPLTRSGRPATPRTRWEGETGHMPVFAGHAGVVQW